MGTQQQSLSALIQQLRAESGTATHLLQQLEEKSGLATQQLTTELGQLYATPVFVYSELSNYRSAFDVLPYSDCIQRDCVLLRDEADTLLFVFANVFDATLNNWAAEKIARPFKTRLASRQDITAYLTSQEEAMQAMSHAMADADDVVISERVIDELSLNSIEQDESHVVRMVRSTLYDALKSQASDIHLEAGAAGLSVKYRLDGVMNHIGDIKEKLLAEQMVSRVKVMADLDITETRVPQDGRFRARYKNREIDFRVSVMPSVHGEDIVIRVLDKKSLTDEQSGLHLGSLGLESTVMATLRRQFKNPYGMILVTGPTGSGKTTTLYAALTEINSGLDKIITIEDPVEYELAGVLQIPVNEKKGLTFARGLRSILRHDPDKIMVGEIRDSETAQIAVQSALTGHLVLTTVHANNVFDVIGRFLNMGVDPYSFVSALNIIVAQRLIRTVCPACATPISADAALASLAQAEIPADATPVIGKGCGECRGSGYKGRKAIAEVLCLDDALREMIAARESIKQIKAYAHQQGTLLLRDAALNMAWQGETTIEEVNRVTSVA